MAVLDNMHKAAVELAIEQLREKDLRRKDNRHIEIFGILYDARTLSKMMATLEEAEWHVSFSNHDLIVSWATGKAVFYAQGVSID